jgi:NADPH:quinone reductase-like Zn-dependent oxidoreductase
MADMMKAVRYHEYGDSKKLLLESVPIPKPKDNEALVKVAYSGVNPIDWKLRTGMFKDYMPMTFPAIPGAELSGVVEALGSGVKGFQKGQKVFGLAGGSYAEYAVVAAEALAPLPEGVGLEEAATVPLGALTAWHTVEAARIQAGQTVLILGAAGGVGLFAAQFAKLKGAKVFGVASAANGAFVKSLGVEAIDYAASPLASRIKDVDVLIDTAGGGSLEAAYGLVKKGGLLLTVAGMPSEEKAKALGISVASGGNRGPEPLGKIQALLAARKLITAVGKVFSLEEAGAAQDLSQTGHGRGRILLKI